MSQGTLYGGVGHIRTDVAVFAKSDEGVEIGTAIGKAGNVEGGGNERPAPSELNVEPSELASQQRLTQRVEVAWSVHVVVVSSFYFHSLHRILLVVGFQAIQICLIQQSLKMKELLDKQAPSSGTIPRRHELKKKTWCINIARCSKLWMNVERREMKRENGRGWKILVEKSRTTNRTTSHLFWNILIRTTIRKHTVNVPKLLLFPTNLQQHSRKGRQ
jgi:hypothetical protein